MHALCKEKWQKKNEIPGHRTDHPFEIVCSAKKTVVNQIAHQRNSGFIAVGAWTFFDITERKQLVIGISFPKSSKNKEYIYFVSVWDYDSFMKFKYILDEKDVVSLNNNLGSIFFLINKYL